MPDEEQRGTLKHVCIFECYPQDDKPRFGLYDEIPADDLDDYENARDIVRGFMGTLEKKQYEVPDVKNARMHDLRNEPMINSLNRLSTYDFSFEASDSSEESEDGGDDSDSEHSFSRSAELIVERYINAKRSVDCFLLLIAYEYESDRFESQDRLMVVQLPFREDVFVPDSDTEELFENISDAFENNLKKSVLYPCQEEAIPDTDNDESEEDDSDDAEANANVYLFQKNTPANYWHEFLRLEEEEHEDEILAEQTKSVYKKYNNEDIDNSEIDDPLGEIESFDEIDLDDPDPEIEDYLDSGVVIEMNGVKIRGLTVQEILGEEKIRFFEDPSSGEVVARITGTNPSFHPVGRSKASVESNSEDEEDSDQEQTKELEIFHALDGFNDINKLGND